jgi:hypothetical protein
LERFFSTIKQHLAATVILVFAVVVYLVLFNSFGGITYLSETVFSTGDSQEYLAYADWISGNSDYCNPNRTYLYPLLITIARSIGGNTGIWLMQFLLWFTGCVLTYATVFRLTQKKTPAAIALVLAASSVSLMVYTHHGLTEVAAFAALAALLFLFGGNRKKIVPLYAAVFISGILAAIKPQFLPLFYVHFAITLIYSARELFRKPVLILVAAFSFLPVAVQLLINKTQYGSFSNSGIAAYNLRNSVYKKVLFIVEENHSGAMRDFDLLPDSVYTHLNTKVQTPSDAEIKSFLAKHKTELLNVWSDNVLDNLQSGNPYINNETHHSLRKFIENFNHNILFGLHCLGLIAGLFYVFLNFRKRSALFGFIFICGAVFYYQIITTGTVYWAGDRLLVSSVALWSVLYVVLFDQLFSRFRSVK